MNRTLRRPMFRMGGSAEGITSGLDTPKRGVVDGPGKYSQDAADMATAGSNLDDVIAMAKSQSEKFAPKRQRANINDFLISLGLDLVSRPRSGNIFQQVARSAKDPFARFLEDKQLATRAQQDRESDLFGSFLQAGLADRKFDKKMAFNSCNPFLIYSLNTEKINIYEPENMECNIDMLERIKELI